MSPPKDTKPLNMNINKALLERIEKYRFKRMFQSRSEAIEFLLEQALKQNPSDRSQRENDDLQFGESELFTRAGA